MKNIKPIIQKEMKTISKTLSPILCLALTGILTACSCPPPEFTPFTGVRVVNMIPRSFSGETNQDSEPFLAVDRSNANRMVGTAFTPNPFSSSGNAPIYVSTNGGTTWFLCFNVPSNGDFGTGDITVSGTSAPSKLYGGILKTPGSLLLNILKADDFINCSPLNVLSSRSEIDQPFVHAVTLGGNDRVYLGSNDFNAADGKTATIDVSLNGGATFRTVRLEPRSTGGAQQNGPSIRTATANDGTVYAAYFGWRSFLNNTAFSDIVVVRDDNGASGTNPFGNLTEPSDNLPGRFVAREVRIPWSNKPTLGNERIGSTLSIAVQPTNSNIVYVAWADGEGSTYTLHVRRSTDRGQTWSGDVRRVENATCCTLAAADNGTVGFLYQHVTSSTLSCNGEWQTHLEQSTDGFGTFIDLLLAQVPASKPDPQFLPYIGDYNFLLAIGDEFRGVFSANNTPNLQNFPYGVQYQRNVDFNEKKLLKESGGTVSVSIDPFYFSVPVR